MKKHYTKLIQGSALLFLGNIIGMGSSFFLRFSTARIYGSQEYGIIVLGISIVNLVSLVALLGLPQGLARDISFSDETQRGGIVTVSVIISVVLVLILLVLPVDVYQQLNIARHQSAIQVFLLSIPFLVFIRLAVGIFRGEKYVTGRVIVENILSQGLPAAVIVILAISGFSYVNSISGWVAAMILSSLLCAILLSRVISIRRFLLPIKPQLVYKMLIFSIPLMLSDAIWKIMQQSDNFIISYYLGPNFVGIYDASFTLARILELAPGTVAFLMLPILTELYSSDDLAEMKKIYQFSSKWMAFATLPILLLFVFTHEQLIPLVFGEEYSAGTLVLPIVTTGFFTHALLGINKGNLTAIGQTREVLLSTVFAAIINVILNILLIPYLGVIGAALASAFSYICLNFYLSSRLYSYVNIWPISSSTARSGFYSVVASATIWYVFNILGVNSLYLFLIIPPVHVMIIYYSSGVSQTDREIIRDIING